MSRLKNRGRKRKPKFKKNYKINKQDEPMTEKMALLQKVHTRIAKKIFKNFQKNNIGDWTVQTMGLNLYIDPVFGPQAEIAGSSMLPLSKRVMLHVRLLKLIRRGYSTLKAVKTCLLTLQTQ